VTPSSDGLTYAGSGVDYRSLDPAKVMAQRAAGATAGRLARWGAAEVPASRGESAYVWEEPDGYRAFVTEGLGTKSLVADAMRRVGGRTYYDAIAQDTVAMIVNDVIAVGAAPQLVSAFWAAGDTAWFEDRERTADLVRGWAAACDACGATWAGGETETLNGIVEPGAIDLAGACLGIIRPKSRLVLGDRLADGDAIVLFASSGIHANGLTLVRRIAERLPDGYATDIGDGTSFGEALLVPTHLYGRLLAEVFESGLDVHYLANITGHGWRKLMRARRQLGYRIHTVPDPGPLFAFICEQGSLAPEEAYGNLNMGAGYAAYVPPSQAATVVEVAHKHGIEAWIAGRVEAGPRAVILEPVGVTFAGSSLSLRS
jgi:phosphoribosylformylglycinamidine cyclo-ligase